MRFAGRKRTIRWSECAAAPGGAGQSPPPTERTECLSRRAAGSSAPTDRRTSPIDHPGQRCTAERLRPGWEEEMGGNRSRDHPQRDHQRRAIPQSRLRRASSLYTREPLGTGVRAAGSSAPTGHHRQGTAAGRCRHRPLRGHHRWCAAADRWGSGAGNRGVLSPAGEAQRLLARVLASPMAFWRAASPS